MSGAGDAEERGRNLHDLATRGRALSPDEQAELDAWYARQDEQEKALLDAGTGEPSLATLRARVGETVARLCGVTDRIQELSAQNEALRQEIATLQRQLARTSAPSAP